MPSSKPLRMSCRLVVLSLCLICSTLLSAQGTGGRILGRVSDSSGAVLAGVKVTLTNEATGVIVDTTTNSNGDYGFPQVAVGTYTLSFDLTGFKTNERKGITVELNQVVTFNSTLQIGETKEVVEVTSEAPLVDTTSTQLGAIVNNRSMNELPLNQRDAYQFLQLQPGVQSQLGSSGSTLYGSDQTGSVSVNGGRGRANNFSVNGGDANDQFVNLPTVQPSPDAIEEFRVITNTFDAEYGRNSGSVVNVVTKSGTNGLHGDVYEYFRNTVLNAQGYFNTVKPQENQNQFGGTLGGPIVKDRTFFFTSYEGRRIRQGISGEVVTPPTKDERMGDFTAAGAPFGGTANSFIAQTLDGRMDPTTSTTCDAALGLPAGGINALVNPVTGTVPWSTVFPFPTNTIPVACMDPVALNLLQYVPAANNIVNGTYQAVPVQSDTQDQFTVRIDHKINDKQNLSIYYYYTNDSLLQPFYNFQYSGANIPGYGANVGSRYQQWNPSHTWTISNSLVNEFRFTYMREGQLTFQHPQHTGAVTSFCTGAAANECFNGTSDSSFVNAFIASQNVPPGKAGITPGLPSNRTGLPFIGVSGGFNIGNGWEGELPQVGNTFQWADDLSWVKGNHTTKFGADIRRSRFDQTLYYNVSGDFTFDSSGPNAIGYADNYPGYLLGLPDTYSQGSAQTENVRDSGVYLFAQDSWKIKSNLTLNYGLRWELDTPLTDVGRRVQTFRAGQTSTVYPCTNTPLADCPTGLVVPGDSGIPAGLTSTYYKAFAPRIGLAYSPNFNDGFLGKVFGSNGKTSIRTGWGLFYNPMEQLVLEQFSAEPPFGSSPGLSATLFNTPFISQGGTVTPNGFNGILDPPRGQDPGWAAYRPILLYGDFQPHLRTQYTVQYNFSIQRELAKDLLWQINYVGSQGHRLLASHDINPSNPKTCVDIMAIAAINPTYVQDGFGDQVDCGPYAEDAPFVVQVPSGFTSQYGGGFHLPNGQTVAGTGQTLTFVGLRPYSSPNCNWTTGANCPTDGTPVFTNIFAEDTIADSSYNSFQTMLEKRFSHGLQFQAAYTWSKSLDLASSFEETLNPFDFNKSRALSLFNSAQRFVINYYWELPLGKHQGWVGKVVDDWAVSGITQFQSGFPIRMQTQDDAELISSLFFFGTASPQLIGPFQTVNPKTVQTFNTYDYGNVTGHFYFNADQTKFIDPPLGTFSTTPRTLCCGPGENQWDITFSKRIALSEARYFQFRADIFNVFNKTQFYNPDGNFSDTTFGEVLQARDPRLVQFALKFYF
ncbi:MAG: carboxypeptidase regulatory-like domain-containing protein [Terriglobales bacterium]